MMAGSDQPSSLQSICHVQAAEIFPKATLESEDASLIIPFSPVCGESVEYLGRTSDGVLALSNYRLFLQLKDTYYNIPLGLIELLEVREIFFLYIGCKDARSLRCTFASNEQCLDWFRRLHKATSPGNNIEDIFAFAFFAWSIEEGCEQVTSRLRVAQTHKLFNFSDEVRRLKFDVNGAWRISHANLEYKLCPSYPRQLLVPACISDEVLETVARFRSARRIPAVVWRHVGNGAVLARCSQPEVGWLGWRSSEDEDLLKALSDACAFDRGHSTMMDGTHCTADLDSLSNGTDDSEQIVMSGKKVMIMDARSYTTAVANRARGGGCECPEYYPSCDIQFMNLANIHSIRKSFHAVRQLCSTAADQPNWFSLLENTRWLQHMSGLLRAAVIAVSTIEEEGRPVLVHCSDGWDRTPQIIALAELLLDPYYRTLDGFRVLVEREWLDFGHKFADRCGHTVGPDDPNERCPVFLQWLDCVHQVLLQFPCAFEFSQPYLVKLAQHIYSNLFGTFLGNSLYERQSCRINERTFSVWNFLKEDVFRNHLFTAKDRVLWPSYKVRDLVVWCEVYLGAGETSIQPAPTSSSSERSVSPSPIQEPSFSPGPTLSKTRSYGDLVAAQEDEHIDPQRRSSDPNIPPLDTLNILSEELQDKPEQDPPEEDIPKQDAPEQDTSKQVDLEKDIVEDKEENELPKVTSPYTYKDGVLIQHLEDSDNEESETTESRSDTTVHSNNIVNDVKVLATKSIESSTDTLVSGVAGIVNSGSFSDPVINDSVKEVFIPTSSLVNGSAKSASALPNGNEFSTEYINGSAITCQMPNGFNLGSLPSGDDCKVCASSRKFLADKDGSTSSSTSGKTSRYSTPPLYSRTPSSGYPTPIEERTPICRYHSKNVSRRLDDIDGLAPIQNDVQTRLHQIITEYRIKEEALQRDLHSTRMALIQQVCHSCSHNNNERLDDAGSIPESLHSEQASAGESLPSDVSWEAVEDAGPTLWVPDHAVSHCMGCDTIFWIGRRKHHCRNCGKIFCSDCSDNTVPLPDEQLYDPVRVCTTCYGLLNHNILPLNGRTTGFTHTTNGENGVSSLYSEESHYTNGYSTDISVKCTNGREQSCKQETNGVSGTNGHSCPKSVAPAVST